MNLLDTNLSRHKLLAQDRRNQLRAYVGLLEQLREQLERLIRDNSFTQHGDQKDRRGRQLYRVCCSVGIDPLVAEKPPEKLPKGTRARREDLLRDYHIVVATQTIDLARKMHAVTGGYLDGPLLLERLNRYRRPENQVTREDVEAALELLGPLQAGYSVCASTDGQDGGWVLCSQARGLGADQMKVYLLARRIMSGPDRRAYFELPLLKAPREKGGLGWSEKTDGNRARDVVREMMSAGIVWMDRPPRTERDPNPLDRFYVPSLISFEDLEERARGGRG